MHNGFYVACKHCTQVRVYGISCLNNGRRELSAYMADLQFLVLFPTYAFEKAFSMLGLAYLNSALCFEVRMLTEKCHRNNRNMDHSLVTMLLQA